MSTINSNFSPGGDVIALALLKGAPSAVPNRTTSSASGPASGSKRGSVTNVQLSDKAKTILAETKANTDSIQAGANANADQAFTDKVVAGQLQAALELSVPHSVGGGIIAPGIGIDKLLELNFAVDAHQLNGSENITVTKNSAAAVTATTSSDSGFASVSAVAAYSNSKTFALDFTNGTIKLTRADASITYAAEQRSLSIVA